MYIYIYKLTGILMAFILAHILCPTSPRDNQNRRHFRRLRHSPGRKTSDLFGGFKTAGRVSCPRHSMDSISIPTFGANVGKYTIH